MFYFNKTVKIISVIFIVAFFSVSVFAHDSDVQVKQAGGGLVLQQREDIAMVSQEIYISAGLVEVNYIFLNRLKHDVMATVTFSLPSGPIVPMLCSGHLSTIRQHGKNMIPQVMMI